jgi:uncharacterized Fe-S cluster-containing protein
MTTVTRAPTLPGLNCGVCGYRSCADLSEQLDSRPELLRRCIHLSNNRVNAPAHPSEPASASPAGSSCVGCGTATATVSAPWRDSLGRDFDFYLEHFPEDPGPREIIIPHNPMLTREMEIKVGDTLIGRPLGMSCGCPITHCGVAVAVDSRTGVITWCVTGPLGPRRDGFKDLGYYIAEGYEGLISETRTELKIGARYYFQPRMCMLQWRHSGLINFLNRTAKGTQVRLEGLWIG